MGKLFYSGNEVAQGTNIALSITVQIKYLRDTENVSFWIPDILEYGKGEAGMWKQTQKSIYFPPGFLSTLSLLATQS